MSTAAFDALAYFEKLIAAGVPEAQAKIQADALRDFTAIQEERAQKELASRSDLREVELRLQNQIEQARSSLLKWQIGIAVAILTVVARGFGWLGF